MEDDQKKSKWKTTKKFKIEDDQKNSEWKTTKKNQNGRRPNFFFKWKMIKKLE